eukprot:CAMPEP_0115488494 /NCGR_PEP_ID=MMETSP0271-20121206/61505_1 /TAXON_ID=71861 /ORGANISM="Scrippsiella trochoidea, Strain CCMP3099" /LENGTH=160 /DNA_ID=CAMNT_0002916587 /DNA_START=641 /DNA_END=1124 /DNA_ORIENTATION=+
MALRCGQTVTPWSGKALLATVTAASLWCGNTSTVHACFVILSREAATLSCESWESNWMPWSFSMSQLSKSRMSLSRRARAPRRRCVLGLYAWRSGKFTTSSSAWPLPRMPADEEGLPGTQASKAGSKLAARLVIVASLPLPLGSGTAADLCWLLNGNQFT